MVPLQDQVKSFTADADIYMTAHCRREQDDVDAEYFIADEGESGRRAVDL